MEDYSPSSSTAIDRPLSCYRKSKLRRGGAAADLVRQAAKVSTQPQQLSFFAGGESAISDRTSGTFVDNTRLTVRRWFRYSAGFSAQWVESVVADFARGGKRPRSRSVLRFGHDAHRRECGAIHNRRHVKRMILHSRTTSGGAHV